MIRNLRADRPVSEAMLGGGTVRFSGRGKRSNTITGRGDLEKSGANTLTLTGNNTFVGVTTISDQAVNVVTRNNDFQGTNQ